MASSSSTELVYVEPLNAPTYTDSSRVVRFDNQCVLIPEYSSRRRPRMVTKSYSLPLWKRRPTPPTTITTQTSDSENTDDPTNTTTTTITTAAAAASTVPPPLSSSPEETHVVIKVPIPSFVRRSSRSPSGRGYGRSPSTSPVIPLSPCLVYRAPSSFPSSHPSASASASSSSKATTTTTTSPISPSIRRTSLPNYHRRPDDQTVPLRACCPDCVRITEECLEKGSTWQEKFTRGARRRRSASLDSTTSNNTSTTSSTLLPSSSSSGKSAVAVGFVPSAFDARMPLPTLAATITVDEVDKRRKSQESSRSVSPTCRFTSSTSSTTTAPSSKGTHDRDHHHLPDSSYFLFEKDYSSPSTTSDDHSTTTPTGAPLPKRKASPIAEEDENELFPLPSPRRSPNSSRTPSSSGGSSPKEQLSPRASPIPLPSSLLLHPSSAAVVALKLESPSKRIGGGSGGGSGLRSSNSSEEVLTTPGISRKENLGLSSSSTPPQSGTSTPRGPTTTMTKPKPASLTLAFPIVQPNNNSGPTSSSSNTAHTTITTPETPAMVLSSSFTSTSSSISSSSFTSRGGSQPKSPITPTSPRSPTLAGGTGTRSSNSKGQQRKLSFTLPFLKATEAIRGAGVDVLRGVSSISGGGSGGSMMGSGM